MNGGGGSSGSSALWIDGPRSTVAWSKLFGGGGPNCFFCLPGKVFQQLAHRAGKSMSGLRDDNVYDDENENDEEYHQNSILLEAPGLGNRVGATTNESDWRHHSSESSFFRAGSSSNSQDHHNNNNRHHICYGDSVVSDMTESEFSCFVSLSEDDSFQTTRKTPIALSPLPATTPATATASIPTTPKKSKGFPPKPPSSISPHRPPSIQSSTFSRNNRSFVTTGSAFSEASSSVPSFSVNGAASASSASAGTAKNQSKQQTTNKSLAGDSSSSVASFHRRAAPMHYNESYQACVEDSLSDPNSLFPTAPLKHQQQSPLLSWRSSSHQEQILVVERKRLDSEVSALEMESGLEEENLYVHPTVNVGGASEEEDSVDYSPFPLLQHKGEGRLPSRAKTTAAATAAVNKQERKAFPALPPPPPPPPPLVRKVGLVEYSPNQRRKPTPKKHRKLRRKWRRSRPSQEIRRVQTHHSDESSEPMDFLCKSAILEGQLLLRSKETQQNQRVVVSGWIVVLFRKAADTDKMLCSSISSNSSSSSAGRGSLSPGFGAEDLYYLRIVEDSGRSASLVLHRSMDGRQEHILPIEASWVIESLEPEDRRLGRSISVRFGRENGLGWWLCMIPVALQDGYRAKLDQNLRITSSTSKKPACDRFYGDLGFVLPPPGKFAPDEQLDIARHLFFTIDSFVKQQP